MPQSVSLPARAMALVLLAGMLSATALGQKGPVAYYAFEDGYADSSGNNLTGTPHGNAAIVYDSARRSRVLHLDGATSYLDLGNNALFNFPGSFSAAFWIKVRKWNGDWDTILKKPDCYSFERHWDRSMLAFYHWPNFVPTAATLNADSSWHHIAATFDGTTQSIYLDGFLVQSATSTGVVNTNSNHLYLGAAEGPTRFFSGSLDDVRIFDRALSSTEVAALVGAQADTGKVVGPVMDLEGNYELEVEVDAVVSSGPIRVFFSGDSALAQYAFAEVQGNYLRLGRRYAGGTNYWKTISGAGSSPYSIKILKKGSYYRFWANGATAWMRGPLGEWEGVYEPRKAKVGVITPDSSVIRSFRVTTLPWLDQVTEALIPVGPPGSYYEAQIIPGAVLKVNSTYYIYFMAGMTGNQEGAFGRKIGVAWSTDLRTWTVKPEPILSYEQLAGKGDNLYPGGAVITPEGKIALMYSVQLFPEWKGFYLAVADSPAGPFTNYASNPVYQFSNTAHEFDLIRVDQPAHRYILMFAGFTTSPPSGPVGDRGYAIYSDDLMHWTADPRNPVFSPSTLDNWDAVHIRPRSLNLIGDTYYLWYEGTNTWKSPVASYVEWWDQVGLARSKDLVTWEYYPRNPNLTGMGISASQWDKNWVGWPRMIIEGDTGYVFYTGDGQTGMRTIAISELTNWESEGGNVTGIQTPGIERNGPTGAMPQEFVLHESYPNPCNPTSTILLSVPRNSHVSVTLWNVLGQKIKTLCDENLTAGTHRLTFDGTGLAGGVYFYSMVAEGFHATRRLVLLK
jgi:hypothetical protein